MLQREQCSRANLLNLKRSQGYACDLEHKTQSSSQQSVNVADQLQCLLVFVRAKAGAEAVLANSYLPCFTKMPCGCKPQCKSVRLPAPCDSKQNRHSIGADGHTYSRIWSPCVYTVMYITDICTGFATKLVRESSQRERFHLYNLYLSYACPTISQWSLVLGSAGDTSCKKYLS